MSRIRTFLTSKLFVAASVVLIGGAIYIASLPRDRAIEETIRLISEIRVSPEAQEGLGRASCRERVFGYV